MHCVFASIMIVLFFRVFAVVIAVGKRPVSFRTRKLSLPALMVLHSVGCGRVSHCRNICEMERPEGLSIARFRASSPFTTLPTGHPPYALPRILSGVMGQNVCLARACHSPRPGPSLLNSVAVLRAECGVIGRRPDPLLGADG